MHRLETNTERPAVVEVELDGSPLAAYPGESVATAILASGRRTFRHTRSGSARGPFCNMGVCFDCLIHVQGVGTVRACMIAVKQGMKLISLQGAS